MIMIQLFAQLYRDFSNSFEMSKVGELSQEELLGTHSSLERKNLLSSAYDLHKKWYKEITRPNCTVKEKSNVLKRVMHVQNEGNVP